MLLSENENSLLTQAGADRTNVAGIAAGGCRRGASGRIARAGERARCGNCRRSFRVTRTKWTLTRRDLPQLEERLNLIHSLKRKYGATLAEVIAFGDEAKQKLQSLESRDAELARINAALAEAGRGNFEGRAKTFRRAQAKSFRNWPKPSANNWQILGFKQSKFDVAIDSWRRGNESQIEEDQSLLTRCYINQPVSTNIEFQFAPNPGEPAKPLRAIASSGEMARVMLALKTVLAAEDEIPVLIFDEVDANVGGETANAVGEKMKQIAAKRQVLCITHLPQVAAPADAHYVVTKQIKDGRTISEIALLDKKARVTELARMLGGQSDAARKHAEALLG